MLLLQIFFALWVTAPYPPPGKMVDVGGYRVHLYCTGEQKPTVMIVGAGFSFDWSLVQPEVAKFARVCTYDVSGTAWSEPGPTMTCAERVNEVHKLLGKANIDGPYVFVGLSVGALVARLYASRYPSDVAGIVIVDHAFIDVGGDRPSMPMNLTAEDMSQFGKLPEKAQELHRWAMSLKPALPTVETARDCLSQVKDASLGDTPLAVVSTGNEHPNYLRLQDQLLALSSRSLQLIAERSFHSVEIDQPEVVVEAIRRVVKQAR